MCSSRRWCWWFPCEAVFTCSSLGSVHVNLTTFWPSQQIREPSVSSEPCLSGRFWCCGSGFIRRAEHLPLKDRPDRIQTKTLLPFYFQGKCQSVTEVVPLKWEFESGHFERVGKLLCLFVDRKLFFRPSERRSCLKLKDLGCFKVTICSFLVSFFRAPQKTLRTSFGSVPLGHTQFSLRGRF